MSIGGDGACEYVHSYTSSGRIVAGLAMMCNLILNSYPITIICITFGDCWAQYQKDQFRKKRRAKLLRATRSGDDDIIASDQVNADLLRRQTAKAKAQAEMEP
eukprot:gene405-6521_t